MYLNEDRIIEVVQEYILDKRSMQAVLIDGEWGCGKTHFVKEILQKRIDARLNKGDSDNKQTCYISLYGISTIQELIDELYYCIMEAFIEKKFKKGELYGKSLNIISKIAATACKHFNIDTADLPKIEDFFELKDRVLIFDDLERCDIDINKILGFLNELTEHNGLKVIIIANQYEIGKVFLAKELASKYSIILNENLALEDKHKRPLSFEMLKKYAEQLFSHDIIYDKIKEKLICFTIHFQVDLYAVYPCIVKQYTKGENLQNCLLTNINHVIKLFEDNKYYNLRTLIFAVTRFEKIYNIIKAIDFKPSKYIEDQLTRILLYCVRESIIFKGNFIKDSIVNKIPRLSLLNNCEAIENYIQFGFLDEAALIKYITDIATECRERDKHDNFNKSLSYNKIKSWWELEDEEIITHLTSIKTELTDKKYLPGWFKEIIVLLITLKYNEFEMIVYEEYINEMVKYLKDMNNNEISADYFYVYFSDRNFISEYNEIIKPLLEAVKQKSITQKADINSCFDKEYGWGEEFNNNCSKIELAKNCGFLNDVNTSLLIEKLKNSKLVDLYSFLDCVRKVYSFSNADEYFKSDIPHINEILNFIKEYLCIENRRTRKVYFSQLQNLLKDSLESLENIKK